VIEVRTQAQLNKALKKTSEGRDELIVCQGDGYFRLGGSATVRAGDSATVEAGGSATVRAGDSATVRAWDSATVEAWDSATVRAWDSATVRAGGSATVEAWGSATVRAGGSATVRARPHTPVIKSANSKDVTISGGQVIEIPVPKTSEEWCSFHGVEVREEGDDTVAILFKALGNDLVAHGGFTYELGEVPIAPDWDGGKRECGGGLHFSPTPWQAKEFRREATRYLACPVSLADLCVHPDGIYPQKVKAPGCCAPIWEVDVDGNKVEAVV
jgi:hypothetical protein